MSLLSKGALKPKMTEREQTHKDAGQQKMYVYVLSIPSPFTPLYTNMRRYACWRHLLKSLSIEAADICVWFYCEPLLEFLSLYLFSLYK